MPFGHERGTHESVRVMVGNAPTVIHQEGVVASDRPVQRLVARADVPKLVVVYAPDIEASHAARSIAHRHDRGEGIACARRSRRTTAEVREEWAGFAQDLRAHGHAPDERNDVFMKSADHAARYRAVQRVSVFRLALCTAFGRANCGCITRAVR